MKNIIETITAGMGATMIMWSDRKAGTIIEVSESGKSLVWQQDTATRIDKDGITNSQRYSYEPDADAYKQVYTLRKNGGWVAKGTPMNGGTYLWVGIRDEHYDYNF